MTTAITNVDETGDTRTILDLNLTVAHGETVHIEDDELAKRLLEQKTVWARTTTKAAKEAKAELAESEDEA